MLLPGLVHRLQLCAVQVTQKLDARRRVERVRRFAVSDVEAPGQTEDRGARLLGLAGAHLRTGVTITQAARDLDQIWRAVDIPQLAGVGPVNQLDVLRQPVGEGDLFTGDSVPPNTAASRS